MNIQRTLRSVVPFATTGLLALACGGATHGTPVTGTQPPTNFTASQGQADTTVVDRLASARCDQEQSCNNVGPGAKFASRTVCRDKVHSDFANDLNASKCPRGLDSAGVDRCVSAIQGEECNHPLDTLSRDDTCRSGALCLK